MKIFIRDCFLTGGGNSIPDNLFLRLKLCRVGCKSFPFDFLLFLIQPPLCPVLRFGHTRSGWRQQIDLMQKFAATQIHEGFLQVLQVLVCYMVLVPCLAINGPFHKRPRRDIQFPQTVDHNMYMNVAAVIMTVHMRTDQSLMTRKVGFCIFQSKLLCSFTRQAIFCAVPWIKADNVMVAFDFILVFVLLIFTVQLLAGRIEGIGFTVQAVQIKLIPHDTISIPVKDRSFPKLVMLENQILQCSAIVGTLTCDVL